MGTLGRLYRGENSFDFIGHRRKWYVASGLLVLASTLLLLFNGLNLGIDFTGGTSFQFEGGRNVSTERAEEVLGRHGIGADEAIVQQLGGDGLRIRTEALERDAVTAIAKDLATTFGLPENEVSPNSVGPNWGRQISVRAIQGLFAFLLLVVIYISIRFEWKMAVAAFAAVVHDLVATAGIYSLVGFEVTPSTVIALLTILGYSMYDTIVVFDRVREDTEGITGNARMTYSEAANMALNETVMRSINTSLTSLIPVGALLFIGVGVLQAGTLKDLSLSLFVGLLASTYSSIFVATPLLTDLKEREQQMKQLRTRVHGKARTAAAAAAAPKVALAGGGVATADGASAVSEVPRGARPAPRPARPPKRKGGRPSGKKRR